MPYESPYCYTSADAFTYTEMIQVVIAVAGALMVCSGGRVLRGVVLLLIGTVIIPLSGMQEWELSHTYYPAQPIPLAGIIPIALAAGIAYVLSVIAEPIIRILAVLMFWSCRTLFWPLSTYNKRLAARAAAWWGSE